MMKDKPSIAALIPARSGSKRVPDKNIRLLNGHPLIAYTITAAIRCGIFKRIIVSTDSPYYAGIARYYGADVPFLRPAEMAGEFSSDIEWVRHLLETLKDRGQTFDCFSILRPTSPFRQPDTIQRAWEEFLSQTGVDSLRAVEKCRQHPGKMWVVAGKRMNPLLPFSLGRVPWHSNQYAALPEVFVQNASLEIAWTSIVFDENPSIAGKVLMPFFTQGYEGFDINQPLDWKLAEYILETGEASLPEITVPAFQQVEENKKE